MGNGRVNSDVTAAKVVLDSDGVIAYPTEAVYGLGCDPHSEVALNRILDIKGRQAHKGFILIAASQEQLTAFLSPIPAQWQSRLDAAWPGPVTFVIPAAPDVSGLLTGGRDTLAVRVSNHPLVRQLCTSLGHALVSTSANRSGNPALRTADEVRHEFGDDVDAIIEGAIGNLANPTSIIDIQTDQRLR